MSDATSSSGKVRKGDGRRQRGNRSGFTTGACSAAAARAATLGLLTGEVPASVVCHLPNGHDVSFAVSEGRIVERGAPQQLFHAPQHPHTQALVRAVPRIALQHRA